MAPIPNPLGNLPAVANEVIASLVLRSPQTTPEALPKNILSLLKRQASRILHRQTLANPSIMPTTYGSQNSSMAPGTVAGIVLGSVAGFLLVLWLIYTCVTMGGITGGGAYTEEVVVRRKSGSRSTGARSRRMSETVEIRRDTPPVRVVREEPRVERVIVEESRQTRRERSRGGSAEVVVIEEHSPPRRSKSKKDRDSGYRSVDPHAYGGVVGGRRGSGSRR
ncbi:hypothetical protein B0O99DRAFT_592939 [Bisporella sp. PMI_857]|nr:hypothetical protein B0O99DRAFT_592939 [Bisporella sp. PMI_857]